MNEILKKLHNIAVAVFEDEKAKIDIMEQIKELVTPLMISLHKEIFDLLEEKTRIFGEALLKEGFDNTQTAALICSSQASLVNQLFVNLLCYSKDTDSCDLPVEKLAATIFDRTLDEYDKIQKEKKNTNMD